MQRTQAAHPGRSCARVQGDLVAGDREVAALMFVSEERGIRDEQPRTVCYSGRWPRARLTWLGEIYRTCVVPVRIHSQKKIQQRRYSYTTARLGSRPHRATRLKCGPLRPLSLPNVRGGLVPAPPCRPRCTSRTTRVDERPRVALLTARLHGATRTLVRSSQRRATSSSRGSRGNEAAHAHRQHGQAPIGPRGRARPR